MKNYLFERLRGDALAALARSEAQENIVHAGLRGRFREIFVTDLLSPWLPPVCACGTGTIICGKTNTYRIGTQDDIIIYDKSSMPPILVGSSGEEGVFLFNGVLLRIEVKSTLRNKDLKRFANSSVSLSKMGFTVTPIHKKKEVLFGVLNMIFAFASDLHTKAENEFERFQQIFHDTQGYEIGMISAVCIAGKGFWLLQHNKDKEVAWHKLKSDDPGEQMVHFISMISSSAYREHQNRSGQDWTTTLAAGISLYLTPEYEEVKMST